MKRGFSLIEVIVAIVVFLILTSGIYSSINALLYKSGKLKLDTEAATWLAQGLEGAYRYYSSPIPRSPDWCSTVGFVTLASVGIDRSWDVLSVPGSYDAEGFSTTKYGGIFSRRIEIGRSSVGARYKCDIKVTVKWEETSGSKEKEASLTLI